MSQPTDSRESVSTDEKLLDVSAALSMLLMTLDTARIEARERVRLDPVIEKAREALMRSRR